MCYTNTAAADKLTVWGPQWKRQQSGHSVGDIRGQRGRLRSGPSVWWSFTAGQNEVDLLFSREIWQKYDEVFSFSCSACSCLCWNNILFVHILKQTLLIFSWFYNVSFYSPLIFLGSHKDFYFNFCFILSQMFRLKLSSCESEKRSLIGD